MCSTAEQQKIADDRAKEYNQKNRSYERMIAAGYTDITKTSNGGISYENSKALYVTSDGRKASIRITATGNRNRDFDAANKALGLEETPDDYVWHHVDDYNVEDNTLTIQLVYDEVHGLSRPHAGACAQYDAVHGKTYNK